MLVDDDEMRMLCLILEELSLQNLTIIKDNILASNQISDLSDDCLCFVLLALNQYDDRKSPLEISRSPLFPQYKDLNIPPVEFWMVKFAIMKCLEYRNVSAILQ